MEYLLLNNNKFPEILQKFSCNLAYFSLAMPYNVKLVKYPAKSVNIHNTNIDAFYLLRN